MYLLSILYESVTAANAITFQVVPPVKENDLTINSRLCLAPTPYYTVSRVIKYSLQRCGKKQFHFPSVQEVIFTHLAHSLVFPPVHSGNQLVI